MANRSCVAIYVILMDFKGRIIMDATVREADPLEFLSFPEVYSLAFKSKCKKVPRSKFSGILKFN